MEPSPKYKYLALVAGGIGPNVWDKEIEIEAQSMLDAVTIITKQLDNVNIVSIEQVD